MHFQYFAAERVIDAISGCAWRAAAWRKQANCPVCSSSSSLTFQLGNFRGQARGFRFERFFLLAGAGAKLANALVQAQQDSPAPDARLAATVK